MTQVRITLNTAKCQAYAKCSAVAPAVFALGEDRKVRVLDEGGAPVDAIVKAAKSCPYRVITVEEVAGQRLFPPERK
jgi:ferredoxin